MTETSNNGASADPGPGGSPAPVANGFPGRFLDLFRNPARLMDNVGRSPRWWAPLLLVGVVVMSFQWLTMPIAAPETLDNMRDSVFGKILSEEDLAEMSENTLETNPTKRILQALADGVGAVVSVVLFGLILGLFAQLSGGEVKFNQALGICIWGAVPAYAISLIVKLPIAFATGSILDYSVGLALLARGLGTDSFLYKVLFQYGDFFTWWGLALVVLGFRRVFRMALGPAILSVVLPWAVLTGIPLGIMLIML